MPGPSNLDVKISVTDIPAFRVLVLALYEISLLEGEACERAPEMAQRAARDAVAIVRERNP